MSIQVIHSGELQVTDPNSGGLQLDETFSCTFTGTISTFTRGLLVGTASSTITLPISPTQVLYVKNQHTSNSVTCTWTRNGGSTASVVVLQPGSYISLAEANTTSGITALSLAASGASTGVDYFLAG